MADPLALVVADAAAHAVEFVGLPEAQLNLAQAVVHLATAPKSNRPTLGIWTGRWPTCGTVRWARCRPTCATPTTAGRVSLGPRRGLRLPSRRPAGLGGPAVPARRAGRHRVLPARRQRGRGPAGGAVARAHGRPGKPARGLPGGRQWGPMTALDLLTVLCAVLALAAACCPGGGVAPGCCGRPGHWSRPPRPASRRRRRPWPSCGSAVRRANGEVDRIDDLLEVAGVHRRAGRHRLRAAYKALTSPVIKGVALASGHRRAARRLRGGTPSRRAAGDVHDPGGAQRA